MAGAPVPQILSKVVDADRIRPTGLRLDYEPDVSQLVSLATAHGLAGIATLSVHFELQRRGRKTHVHGTLVADVEYVCVVTLEAFRARISEAISLVFEDVARNRGRGGIVGEIVVPVELEDVPEPLEDGQIDLGAITQEFLALGLDPYPRRPGVSLQEAAPIVDSPAPSPFAELAALLPRNPGKKQ